MKAFIVCIFVIINIKSNGRASLDSFLPTNNVLLDTVKSSDKSCHRACTFSVKPRRCYYDFVIEPTVHEDGTSAISVNGRTPGPNIHVCLNDLIVVRVKNKVANHDIAMHWHGVEQKQTPYHDGVPMVTQCPITYGSVYQYSFVASSPGTYFYHADSVSLQSDGVYGPLVVDQPRQPHAAHHNSDTSRENTIIVGARFANLLTGSLEDLRNIKPDSLVMNGMDAGYKAFVIPGSAYLFRLINGIAIECPVSVSVRGHALTIIASDGKPVKPTPAVTVKLYPGERMDVVVRAVQESVSNWIQVSGSDSCEGLHTYGMLLYSGFNYTSKLAETPIYDSNVNDAVDGQSLVSLSNGPPVHVDKSVYLRVDRNYPQFKDSDNGFSYILDGTPTPSFTPAAHFTQDGLVQINGKNFLYPNTPFLLRPRDVLPGSVCSVGEEQTHEQPQCVQIINSKLNDVVELVLVNEGFGSNDSYTFHMHGPSTQVLATWQSPAAMPLSMEEFKSLDRRGEIIRNTKDPPLKDTVHVPNKGFTILRLKLYSGGSWLLECRSCGLSALPVAVLIDVPQPMPKLVVDSLPSCGGFKPADLLLN